MFYEFSVDMHIKNYTEQNAFNKLLDPVYKTGVNDE